MQSVPISGEVSSETLARFKAKIKYVPSTKCHEWTAAVRGGYDKQYGVFNFSGRIVYAHRFSLYVVLGKDPGPSVDHLCYNSLCVNPEHLRGGSIADNNATRRCIISEFCKNGHLRTIENTYVNSNTGRRRCRECGRIRDKARYQKKYEKEKQSNTHTSEMRDFAANPKLSFDIAEEIRARYQRGSVSQRVLAREYKVSQPLIGMIVRNEVWVKA